MKRTPGVVDAGLTDIGVNTDNNSNTNIIPPGGKRQVSIGQYNVGEGFFNAMGLTLKAGRWFDANRPMDDMTLPYPEDKAVEKAVAERGVNVVLNEYAVRKLGFKSPQDAVGKVVKSELIGPDFGMVDINIIEVVGDSRFRSVRKPIDPIMFRKIRTGPGWLMVRYRGDPATVRAALERQWKQIHQRGPVQRQVQRRHRRRDVQEGGRARAELRRFFAPRRHHRLPRPVRPCGLHRRAANQGDRDPEGARRTHP